MANGKIKNSKDFIFFLDSLKKDFEANRNKKSYEIDSRWANWYIGDFFEAIFPWLKSENRLAKEFLKKQKLSWSELAELIQVGKIYE